MLVIDETADDRKLLATVDQQGFATGAFDPPNQPPNEPLWSGLLDAGVHDLAATDRIVLRAGSEGRPVTADVLVLEEASEAALSLPPQRAPAPEDMPPGPRYGPARSGRHPRPRRPMAGR